jgi:hypothetical protein
MIFGMINGGYILQPRIIQESDISVAPPYVREIWNYLLREANSQDNKYNGYEIKRGQLFRSYEDIREGTKWFIGWRKMSYNENQTKKAMKFLRDTGRIDTMKELGGVMITICKYDYYQDPKNYDRTTKIPKDRTIAEPLQNQPPPDNNKNDKNDKNNNNTWRHSFEVYLNECKEGYRKFMENPEMMKKEQRLNPGVNIKLTIEKGFDRFWGTEDGWINKKSKRTKDINWNRTIQNSIDQKMNKVYYTKEELAKQ